MNKDKLDYTNSHTGSVSCFLSIWIGHVKSQRCLLCTFRFTYNSRVIHGIVPAIQPRKYRLPPWRVIHSSLMCHQGQQQLLHWRLTKRLQFERKMAETLNWFWYCGWLSVIDLVLELCIVYAAGVFMATNNNCCMIF